MLKKRMIAVVGATVVLALGVAGTASALPASGGGTPAAQANCLGEANSGGKNGEFVSDFATSGPGAFGDLARGFGTSGGAGSAASNNDCS
jgi:hypothetical protein